MAITDREEFQAWLRTQSDGVAGADYTPTKCEVCGVAPGAQKFLGDQCVVCLAYQFGAFEKAQQISLMIRDLQEKMTEWPVDALASWLVNVSSDFRPPPP